MSLHSVFWGVVAYLPSPYPLSPAGEGKYPSTACALAIPPLPLAGEGWGEGKPESTLQECFPAPLPYAEALHHSRIESREIPNKQERAYARGLQAIDPRAARHRARRSIAPGCTRNPRQIGRSASVGGTDSRSACDAAGNTKDVVRRRSSSRVARVHSRVVRAWRKISLTLPSPASGRGESACQVFTTREAGIR